MMDTIRLSCRSVAAILLGATAAISTAAQGGPGRDMATADFANQRIAKLHETARVFQQLADQPLPANLADRDRPEAERHTAWLKASYQKLTALAGRWQESLDHIARQRGTAADRQKALEEMNQSFNLQYLTLQQKMQDESRRFSLLSNIMKTKHDTAKNAINNVR